MLTQRAKTPPKSGDNKTPEEIPLIERNSETPDSAVTVQRGIYKPRSRTNTWWESLSNTQKAMMITYTVLSVYLLGMLIAIFIEGYKCNTCYWWIETRANGVTEHAHRFNIMYVGGILVGLLMLFCLGQLWVYSSIHDGYETTDRKKTDTVVVTRILMRVAPVSVIMMFLCVCFSGLQLKQNLVYVSLEYGFLSIVFLMSILNSRGKLKVMTIFWGYYILSSIVMFMLITRSAAGRGVIIGTSHFSIHLTLLYSIYFWVPNADFFFHLLWVLRITHRTNPDAKKTHLSILATHFGSHAFVPVSMALLDIIVMVAVTTTVVINFPKSGLDKNAVRAMGIPFLPVNSLVN